MKLLTTIFLLPFFFFNIYAQEIKMDQISKLINEIKSEYAPDTRVAIFDIRADISAGVLTLTGETNIPKVKEILTEKLFALNLRVTNEINLLPSQQLDDKIYGVINLSTENMRLTPNDRAELVSQVLLGTPVKILKNEEEYYLAQTPDNYIAWIYYDGITRMSKVLFDEWNKSDKVIFTKEYGFSYSLPNETSLRVSDLVAGNILMYLGEENNLIKVKYPDGRMAFVEKSSCEHFDYWLDKNSLTENEIVSTAQSFIGIPYLWGGTSVKGMDCSGFTKTVYFLHGIVLARDASQQVLTGDLVDTKTGFENLLPGDLLFFGFQATDTTKERITHVGIYIGGLEFIHSSGRVKINSLDKLADDFSEFRLTHFIRAKRILTSLEKNGISLIKNNKFYTGEMK